MILHEYIKNPFTTDAFFDFESFKTDIRTASRFLDNVVDINNLPLPGLKEQLELKRRHGLGFTGLGTSMNMLNLAYGSEDSLVFTEKVMLMIAQESLIENIVLAKEKGPAPIFKSKKNRELVLKSKYLERLLGSFDEEVALHLKEQIVLYGLRYSHATSIAPTGTMSLTWGNNCSNGIEPSFSDSYMRNIRVAGKKTKVQETVMSYEYNLWKELNGDMKLPDNWRVADDLSIDDHLKVQAIVQKWVDAAVSKTINVPTDCPFDIFKDTYIKGWKMGLKGVTTFRFNPEAFSGVLVRKEDLEETKYVFVLDDNSEMVLSGADEVEYDGETHNAANLFDALKEGLYGDM